jgi:hypothetical protein
MPTSGDTLIYGEPKEVIKQTNTFINAVVGSKQGCNNFRYGGTSPKEYRSKMSNKMSRELFSSRFGPKEDPHRDN